MRLPRWLKLCGTGTRAGFSVVGTLLLWTSWLALSVSLVALLVVALARELVVPQWALRRIEQRLAQAGLQATFGAATFDPGGHVLVRDVRVSIRSLQEPVLTAGSVYLEIDPWLLLIREVRVRALELAGAELRVPAMLSPSGQSEALVRDFHTLLRPASQSRGFEVPHLAARIGPLQVHVQGAWLKPREGARRRGLDDWLEHIATQYPRMSRRVAEEIARLPLAPDSRLDVQLQPLPDEQASLITAELLTTSSTGGVWLEGLRLENLGLRVEARWPEDRTAHRTPFQLRVTSGAADWAGRVQAEHLRLGVQGSAGSQISDVRFQAAQVTAAAAQAQGIRAAAPFGEVQLDQWPNVQGRLGLRAFDTSWEVTGRLHAKSRAGEVSLAGRLHPSLLQHASERVGRDLTQWLRYEEAPRLRADVVLAEGGRPRSARAVVSSGPVWARGVDLARAGGELHWDGTTARAEDIVLTTPSSEARGRYEMDIASRRFRFLLSGRLQPSDIDGWFREWWSNFWKRFEFADAPAADVDIRGQWGRTGETAVFVAADGAAVRLQGADFDRIRTRLLVRPGFADVLEFIGDRAGRQARGRFSRTGAPRLEEDGSLLEFDVRGDTDLAPAPHLFGEIGAAIVRPFAFSSPPRLHATGTLRNAADKSLRRRDVRIMGAAAGDWTFFQFPLRDLHFNATLRDDVLLLENLEVGFAGGRGTGRAELSGWDDEHRLAFDLSLQDAFLGESIRTLETWSALRRGATPPPVSRFQRQVAAGRLNLGLSAEGRYDDPYSLHGAGNAVITGADLGEINLLGVLSSLLRPTIFNFTTLQLDSARANFDLRGHTLEFHDLRFTGPRAAIDAEGGYRIDTKGLSFLAKVRPFELSEGLLGSTVGVMLTPLYSVLEVKLTGTLDAPAWSFVYGPTNLFRVLSGEPPEAPPPTPPAPTPASEP